MAHQYEPETIFSTIEKIKNRTLVLPAIQRGFVWKKSQIEKLFDSLMQGFPFGTLLYWQMKEETLEGFSIYNFLQDATEQNSFLSTRLTADIPSGAQSVIDGQQRLTALNIGIKGSFSTRKKHARKNKADSYVKEYLYLNLASGQEERTDNDILGSHAKYEFKFRESSRDFEYEEKDKTKKVWFRVGRIIDFPSKKDTRDLWRNPNNAEIRDQLGCLLSDQCCDLLEDFGELIHKETVLWNRSIPSSTDDLDVLEIFTRTNQGGTKLSKGDMIFSMAVNEWKDKDARSLIEELILKLNEIADTDKFSKDLILNAGIMIGPAKANQSRNRLMNPAIMKNMEANWEELERALLMSVELLRQWGITNKRLLSTNALLPVAYYLFLIGTPRDFDESHIFLTSREDIHKFLLFSLAKGVWGAGANTLLDRLRKTLQKWSEANPEKKYRPFPYEQLVQAMEGPRSSLRFTDYDIESLLTTRYGDARCFFALYLLIPDFYSNQERIDIDHVFPRKAFSRANLKQYNLSLDQIDYLEEIKEELPNLVLLSRGENRSKGKKMPSEWLKEDPRSGQFIQDYAMLGNPDDLPQSIVGFEEWFLTRKEKMKEKLKAVLPAASKDSRLDN